VDSLEFSNSSSSSVDEAIDSILYSHRMKIDEEAEPSVEQLQVADDLGLVNGPDFFNGF
jgi:hypothetical protein